MFGNKLLIVALLLSAITVISAIDDDVNLKKDELSSNKTVINVDVERKTTKSTTTTTTTEMAPNTTTTESTTTTSSTIPPTSSSTTSTSTTTTVAPIPTSSTTSTPAPITTTPKPSPFPDPKIGTWACECIMVKMATQLNFTYVTKDDKKASTLYNIPVDGTKDHCLCDTNSTQAIQINWGPDTDQSIMVMQFEILNGTSQVSMIKFTLPLIADKFPNAKENQTIQLLHRKNEFNTPQKMSYHCTRAQVFNATETVNSEPVIGTITVRDVQVEAFRSSNTTQFSTVHDCDSTHTSDIVPIAVGIALVALILIVLISYLCARRRTSSRGYMSF